MVDQTSGANALGQRQTLEEEYLAQVEPEVKQFLTDVQQAALIAGLSALTVMALWRGAIQKVAERGGSPLLLAELENSALPYAAMDSAVQALASAEGLAMSNAQKKAHLAASLGLITEPQEEGDAAPGRLLTPDGAYSWEGNTRGMSRTAATADYGQIMIEMGRDEGYTHKRWMTRYDSRVRETHANADRQTVPLEDNFVVGGATLRYPADPMCADYGEVTNCRCVLVLVKPGDRAWDFPPGVEPWNDPYPGS